ncbi:unnamed protein product [Caenorhabditis angaria]|uniref:Serpentine Receptor, class H n=1 Tax=Caenorhabditis angaria TaxID=860376 RepID=A0A9P1IUZ2_9PELO|nr:unnamed protein product [Caenorhabditis angaria]
MLILDFTSTILDLYLSLFVCPFIFLPYPAGYPLGLFRFLNIPTSVQVYLGMSFIGVVAISLINLLESRYNKLCTITEDSKKRKYRRYFIAIIQYIFSFTFFAPVYFNIPDENYAIQVLTSELYCVDPEKFHNPYFFCLTLQPEIAMFSILSAIILVVPQMIFYPIGSFRYLNKNRNSTSRTTYIFRMKFILALCFQVFIPVIFLVVPSTFVVFSLYTKYFNQGITNLSMIFFATHGGISSIVTLIVHKPYRDFTLQTLYQFKIFRFIIKIPKVRDHRETALEFYKEARPKSTVVGRNLPQRNLYVQ